MILTAALQAPLGSPAFDEELGQQLVWMAHRGVESASLHVSPADLGPIEAHISMQGGAASVWFGASHPDTRAALEQSLPRLRQMFSMHGLALADSGVSREAPRRRPALETRAISPIARVSAALQPAAASVASPLPTTQAGLVDLYA